MDKPGLSNPVMGTLAERFRCSVTERYCLLRQIGIIDSDSIRVDLNGDPLQAAVAFDVALRSGRIHHAPMIDALEEAIEELPNPFPTL